MFYPNVLCRLFIVFAINIHGSETKLYFADEEKERSVISIVNGIQQIADRYFMDNINLLVFDRDHDSKVIDYVTKYLHNVNTPLLSTENITQEDSFNQGDFCWTNENWFSRNGWCGLKRIDNLENSIGFIIIRSTIDKKCFLSEEWKNSSFWNPRAFFLIVIATPVTEGETILTEAIKDCWDKLKILNVVIIFRSILEHKGKYSCHYSPGECNMSVRAMSYNPFSGKPSVYSLFDVILNGYNFFPNKLRNTRGFVIDIPIDTPIHVLLIGKVDNDGNIVLEGPNGLMMNEVVRVLNLSMNITPYAAFKSNEKMKEITSKMAGIQPYQESVQPYNLRRSTYSFDEDCVTLIVPKAIEIPKYLKVILPFTGLVWVLFVSTNICILIIWKIVTVVEVFEVNVNSVRNIFINVFRSSVGGALDYLPALFPQRFVVAMLLIFNFIINNAYTGSLNSCLINVKYLPDVNNLMESLDSDMKIGAVLSISEISAVSEMIDFNDPHVLKIFKKMVTMKSEKEVLDMIANHRNLTLLTLKFVGKTLINNPIYFKNGYPMMHVVEECYTSIWNVFMTVENHSPFLAKLSFFVTRLNEGGLFDKWKSDFLNQATRLRTSTDPIILTREHLQAAFFLLLLGFCVASVALLVEITYYKSKKSFRNIVNNLKYNSRKI